MKKLILLLSLLGLISLNLVAQQDSLTVVVKEEDGSPIENASISVKGETRVNTNQVGKVKVYYPKLDVKPSDIDVLVKNFKVKYINQNAQTHEFNFIMEPVRTFVKGQIIDEKKLMGIARATVLLSNHADLKPTIANNQGFFRIEVPNGFPINSKLVFKINGAEFDKNHYSINRNPRSGELSFVIKIDKVKNPSPKEEKQEEVKESYLVKVYDSNTNLLKYLEIKIAGKTYQSGIKGMFNSNKIIQKDEKIEIKGYKVDTIDVQGKTITLTLSEYEAEKEINLTSVDSTIITQGKDFNFVINKLEIEKQLLTENGIKIRQEMERIGKSLMLQKGEPMDDEQRAGLKRYHHRLEKAFIENELAYQNARERTKVIIEEMKRVIWTEDSLKVLLKVQLEKIESEKEKIESEKERETFIFIVIVAILLLMVAGTSWAVNRIRKQRNQLEATKNQLADTVEVIALKNKKITDSIRYAQTIQEAILPNQELLISKLNEYFLIFQPKDIVSGDFYWFSEVKGKNGIGDKIFIAVVDCTGHGVPGAFMSMIGHGLLNEIILQNNVHDTDKILSLLDKGIISALKQEEKTNDDGMDLCLCCVETQDDGSFKLDFTGAKRPLYYIRESSTDLQILKGNSYSIGGNRKKEKVFTKQELILQEGDMIYLSTDGLIDQNSPNKTKFGSQRLKKMLAKNAHLPLKKQELIIRTTLENHQDNGEQRDDISLLGIRL